MTETFTDQVVVDAVHCLIGSRRSADYYLAFGNLKHHVDFANRASAAYREADSRLQALGFAGNEQRQSIIHDIHAGVIGFTTVVADSGSQKH